MPRMLSCCRRLIPQVSLIVGLYLSKDCLDPGLSESVLTIEQC